MTPYLENEQLILYFENEELTLFLKINILFQLLEIQQNYHKKALEEIEKKLPKMKDALGNSRYM